MSCKINETIEKIADATRDSSSLIDTAEIIESLAKAIENKLDEIDALEETTKARRLNEATIVISRDSHQPAPLRSKEYTKITSEYKGNFINLLSEEEKYFFFKAKRFNLLDYHEIDTIESMQNRRDVNSQRELIQKLQNSAKEFRAEANELRSSEKSDIVIVRGLILKKFSKIFRGLSKLVIHISEYFLRLSPAVQIAIILALFGIFGVSTFKEYLIQKLISL